jgi:hypothetical protein
MRTLNQLKLKDMIRNNSYDTLSRDIQTLKLVSAYAKQASAQVSSIIRKSMEAEVFDFDKKNFQKTARKSVTADSLAENLSKIIYKQFTALKSDFDKGLINQVKYTSFLKTFQDSFTTEDPELASLSPYKAEIAKEIKRYL